MSAHELISGSREPSRQSLGGTTATAEAGFVRDSASWRDPAGCVFTHGGEVFRQVNRSFADDFRLFESSGLHDALVARGLMIPHETVAGPVFDASRSWRILRPEQLSLISYPYEWCFGQLRDAALATLDIQRHALEHGLTLRDASAFNIQPHGTRWRLIDSLSFKKYEPGQPWGAYRQFCQHFLAPLALAAKVDPALLGLFKNHIDGVDLSLAAKLLPWRTRLSLGLGLHVHAHARSLRKHASAQETPRQTGSGFRLSLKQFGRILDHLESTIRGIRLPGKTSTWSGYYDHMHNYSQESFASKHAIVSDFLRQLAPKTVWDLGANTGEFSRLAADTGARTVAWDFDHNCVEAAYAWTREAKHDGILPLVLDLTNPSPDLGWAHAERQSLVRRSQRANVDVVLMLGLIHHLAIGANVPLGHVSQFAAQLGRTLVIEFVSKADSQVRRLLAAREDVFSDYTREHFERAFAQHFEITGSVEIPGTERTLYLLTRK